MAVALANRLFGWVTVAEVVAVHPLASVTVTVYVPEVRPVGSSLVLPPVHW